jgi:hypothetical protein
MQAELRNLRRLVEAGPKHYACLRKFHHPSKKHALARRRIMIRQAENEDDYRRAEDLARLLMRLRRVAIGVIRGDGMQQYVIDFSEKLPPQEQIRKANGMRRAQDHADREWTAAVKHAIWTTARELESFTADDVWERFDRINTHGSTTHLRDAIGPLLKAVATEGAMHGSTELRRSRRPGSHGNPIMVWKSKVHTKGTPS